ncbi:hypothetical protein FACS189451_12210 [Bacteroidia bacterium]|nr:hypothetical protein FACS189451_12210 [Bacteroidia bacterium]
MEYAPIPMSKAQLAIPVKDIPNLTLGASYSDKSGQASVRVRVENDTVFVDAVCDSLLRQVETYEMELNRMRNEVETRLKIEETNNVQTAFKWCLTGFIAGMVLTIIVVIKIKK